MDAVKPSGPWPTAESKGIEVGDRWAYQLKASKLDVTEVIVRRTGTKRPPRVQVEFVDEDYEGAREWVPPVRLVARWEDVDMWLRRKTLWADVRQLSKERAAIDGSDAEAYAVRLALIGADPEDRLLDCGMPDDEDRWVAISNAPDQLAEFVDVNDLAARDGSFFDNGRLVMPWPGRTRTHHGVASGRRRGGRGQARVSARER